jgi:glycosyltransferase involved in cell wall biosynthesis
MSGKARILEVCNQDRFLASPYMLPFLEKLSRQGYAVEAACRVTDAAGALREAGVTVHDLPFTRRLTPARDLRAYRLLGELMARGGYRLVHTHTPKEGVMGRRAAWGLKVPAVLHTCNGYYFTEDSSPLRRLLVVRLEKYAARRCHFLVFVNSEDLALALRRGMARPGRLKYVPNGVDTQRFHPGEDAGLRAELGLAPDAEVVGYVGEVTREKNLGMLLEACEALAADRPGLRLVLVGDAPKEPRALEELRRRAGRGSMAGKVIFAGYRRDVERFYRVFRVYAHPSLREGFGVPLIEAMASGVPVVACRVRGPREVVRDGITGTLVEPGDAAEMAAALSFYLEEEAAVERHTARALEDVRRNWRLADMHRRLLGIYRRLLREAESAERKGAERESGRPAGKHGERRGEGRRA